MMPCCEARRGSQLGGAFPGAKKETSWRGMNSGNSYAWLSKVYAAFTPTATAPAPLDRAVLRGTTGFAARRRLPSAQDLRLVQRKRTSIYTYHRWHPQVAAAEPGARQAPGSS